MKFNYDKFPILQALNNSSFSNIIGINPEHKELLINGTIDNFNKNFKGCCNNFKSSIIYISKPLSEAIISSKDKLLKEDFIMKLTSCSGTILFNEGTQYCYDIYSKEGDDKWFYVFFAFQNDTLVTYSICNGNSAWYYTYDGYTTKEHKQKAINMLRNLVLVLNFIKYADIETKIVKPNRQIWEGINCLYNNKTKQDITILDSTWYTNLVKSEGFKVRGHFRLQPYGEGLSKKKLIWVNDFEKHGYTLKAKKLQYEI